MAPILRHEGAVGVGKRVSLRRRSSPMDFTRFLSRAVADDVAAMKRTSTSLVIHGHQEESCTAQPANLYNSSSACRVVLASGFPCSRANRVLGIENAQERYNTPVHRLHKVTVRGLVNGRLQPQKARAINIVPKWTSHAPKKRICARLPYRAQ
jgi:hypothetical protein